MNRIYRLIWSHVHHAWVIVPERTKGRGKAANRSLVFSALLAATPVAMAGPTGGQVTAGNGTISQSGATTTVTQASQNLSLNWQSFNTTSQETVNFVQPSASAIAVNRIADTNATRFFGQLNANGQVYLINPNGVLFGAGSQINVGGLVASTLGISDAGLGGATRHFSGNGTGSIVNQGTINAAKGGYVAFIGNTVSNTGTINAAAGAAALGAGSDVTLSFSGDSLVNLQVKQSTLNNLAENGGLIKADGGAVWLSAGARDALVASVINNTGIVQARSVQNVNGSIVLTAGNAGTASNGGTLDASGSGGAAGGSVKVLGGTVKLAAGSAIDVSGEGGGTALIGGNFLGSGGEQRAHTAIVDAGASIKADAISRGNGGNVAVWSDNSTQFNGSITARGGAVSGNGGKVETSGKALKVNAGASVSTAAPHGAAGEWLLDPDDILIGNASIWGNDYGINVDTRVLSTALNNGNVTIKTTGASASCTGTTCTPGKPGNGDIIILDGIGYGNDYSVIGYPTIPNWTSNTTLTLSAYRNVQFKLTNNVSYGGAIGNLGGGIVAEGAVNIVLKADNGARGTGTVFFDDLSAIDSNIFLANNAGTVSIYYNPGSYSTPADFTPYINNPAQLTAYMAVNLNASIAPKVYDGTTTAGLAGVSSLLAMPTGLTLDTAGQAASFADKNAGTDKAVTITGVRFTGGGTTVAYNGQHYYLNGLDSKTGTITPKSINVSGVSASDKTYDGTTTATLTGAGISSSDLVGGDIVSLAGGSATGTFADANAGGNKSVAVSGYALTGTDAANYNLVQPGSVTATIHKADLVLSGGKTYDGSTAVAGGTLTATGVAGQTFSVVGAGDASNLASKNVQTGAALGSTTGLVLGSSGNGGLSGNYNALGTAGSSYTVTAKGITLTGIGAVDKTYDATTTAALNTANVAYSGMVAGDSLSLAGQGVGSFATKDAGANKTVSVSGFTLSGLDAGNYVVTQPTGLTASIGKADLAVSGVSALNKTYDAGTGATLSGTATVSGFLNDNVSVVGTGTGSFADANAGGNKSVAVNGYTLTGTDAANYNVVQPGSVTATIHKADLVLSGGKTYDGSTAVAGGTLTATGVAGQTFSVGGAGDASNLASKNVQTGAALGSTTGLVLGSSGNGGLSGNYNALGTAGSSYTVTAKGITLTGIGAMDKTYDATTTATLNTANVAYSGMIAGDSLSLSGQGIGHFASKDAGANKTVSVSGFTLSGLDAGNYVVTQPTGLSATINKADLAVSGVSALNKTYDAGTGATLSGTATVSGFLNDNVSVVGTGTGSFADANAGGNKNVAVSGYVLTGADAANYNVVQPGSVTATIHKADLVLSGGKTYDGSTAVAGGTLTATGVAGQTFSVGGAGDVSNLASKNVQTGAALGSTTGLVLGSSGNGGLSGNYNALGTAGSSYTVTAKGITLTGIGAMDKTYDATTTATLNTANVAYSGMVAGDSLSLGGQGVGSFATKDAGANKTVSVSGFTLSGIDAGNYVVTQPTGLSATINKADLAVSGVSALNKTYDAGTGATLSGTATVSGFLNDNVSVVGTGTGSFADANAGGNKNVAVSGYALTGADASNYNVVQPGSVTATIHKADLILSGGKTYDGSTAVAGGTLTATGVAGQTFSVGGSGDVSNLASKNVQAGTALGSTTGLVLGSSGNGGLSGNYNALGTAGSSYTVTAKGITLTGIGAVDKTYDATTTAALNTANVAYSGMIAGDSLSLSGQGVGSFVTKDAGANKTVSISGFTLSGIDAGNYVVTQPTGLSATISKADLAVSGVSALNKTYDAGTGATLSGTATVSGFLNDNVSVVGTGTGSFADANAGGNKSVAVNGYTLTGTDAANYNVVQPGSVTATIHKADLILSGGKTYDGSTAVAGGTLTATGVAGQTFSVGGAGDASNLASKNVQTGAALGSTTGLVLGSSGNGGLSGNYNALGTAGSSYTVTAKGITLTGIGAVDKTYDATTTAALNTANVAYSGMIAGDSLSLGGQGIGHFASKDAGANKTVSVSGFTLSGIDAGNYVVTQPTNVTATINKAELVLSGISAADKTYDATTTAALNTANVVYSGMMAGDQLALAGHGIGHFASKDAGANKTVSVSGFTLGGLDAGNYVVTQPTGVTASIGKADLAVSGVSALNKSYDAGTGATLSGTATVSGFLNDNVSVVGTGSGSFADANAGSGKHVAVSGYALTGTDASNYNVVQPGSVTATIHKADLILSGGKTYDGSTAVAGGTLTATGVAGQTFSVGGAGDASNLASKNVQTGSALDSTTGLVLGSSGNGGLSGNYNALGTAGSSYTVTAKGITLTGIGAVDKTYDATTTAALNTANVAYSGMIAGDSLSLSGQGVGSFVTKDAGANKTVSISGFTLSGIDAGNYVVTQPTGLSATISKADLAVSGISALNKTYDAGTGATLSGTATVSGFLNDNVSVVGTGSGSFADANAGSGKHVAVSGYALTGADAANYNLVQPCSVTATIHKADLILSGGKTYDGSTAVAGGTLTATGVAGQTFSVGGTGDVSNLASKNVQTSAALGSTTGLVLGSSGNGGLSGNYNVLGTAGSSYTVTAKGITLTGIGAVDKTYDATTTAALNTANVAYSGMVAGDQLALAGQGIGHFASKDAGANKAVSVSGFSLGGADAGNYVVTQPTGLSATISKAELSLAGLSIADKVYDATTAAAMNGTASLSGVMLGDSVSLSGTRTARFADKHVGANKSVTISGYALSGADAGNYNIVDGKVLTASITPASITVSGITAADKVYDATTGATVYTGNAMLAGKFASDVITLASTGQFADAAAGDGKAVDLHTVYGGADAGNYIITGQARAFASIKAAPVVTPVTPDVSVGATQLQQIQSAVTQVQSSVLPPQALAQPQALNLSSTLVVQRSGDGGRAQEAAGAPLLNTTSGFGTPAPMLHIQNGGIQLPLVATSITE